MTDYRQKRQVKFLLLGIMVGMGIFLLLGARSQDDVVLLAADRYQISAWGDVHSHGAFVVDSLTGKTKLVYEHHYQAPENGLTDGGTPGEELEGSKVGKRPNGPQNHLGLPFTQIP